MVCEGLFGSVIVDIRLGFLIGIFDGFIMGKVFLDFNLVLFIGLIKN